MIGDAAGHRQEVLKVERFRMAGSVSPDSSPAKRLRADRRSAWLAFRPQKRPAGTDESILQRILRSAGGER